MIVITDNGNFYENYEQSTKNIQILWLLSKKWLILGTSTCWKEQWLLSTKHWHRLHNWSKMITSYLQLLQKVFWWQALLQRPMVASSIAFNIAIVFTFLVGFILYIAKVKFVMKILEARTQVKVFNHSLALCLLVSGDNFF